MEDEGGIEDGVMGLRADNALGGSKVGSSAFWAASQWI